MHYVVSVMIVYPQRATVCSLHLDSHFRQSIQLHFWMWSYVQISIRYNQTSINDHLSTTATSLATANFLADSPCIDSCLNPPQRTKTGTFFCPQGGCCEEVQPYKPFYVIYGKIGMRKECLNEVTRTLSILKCSAAAVRYYRYARGFRKILTSNLQG